MRAFTACLLALCLAQGAMAAKKQQIQFSPPPPPGPQDFVAPGVSARRCVPCCRVSSRPRPAEPDKIAPTRAIAPTRLQMAVSFIIPGYSASTFTTTQAEAVCAVLKAKAGGALLADFRLRTLQHPALRRAESNAPCNPLLQRHC